MRISLTEICSGWLIDLHGTTGRVVVDDLVIHCNEDAHTSVEICIFNIGDERGTDVQKADVLLAGMYDTNGAQSVKTETIYSNKHIAGKAILYYCIDWEDDTEYWFLEGVKIKGDQYIVSRIGFKTEEYKDWAIRVWNSIMKLEQN